MQNYFTQRVAISSTISHDLTGSSVSNQLVDAGNQSLSSWEVYPILIFKKSDTSNQLLFFVSDNTVYARKVVSGSSTTIHSAAYNATTQKFFRIRENSGTIYFETSPNGAAWTTFTSTATPFTITSVVVGQMVGTWGVNFSTTYALFDNFNVTPGYLYDANGNMTTDGTNCYQYNESNQLDKVIKCSNNQTLAEYVYDYNGNRMVKRNFTSGSLANTVTSWSDAFETKVIVGGSTESTSYYFVNNELIAKKNNDGSKHYYHNDHLGSTAVLTNQSGTLVEETKYDPWGEVKAGGVVSKFQYTGQEKDAETGLNYYGARYYDPHIRRFTQADPIIQNVFDPQALNRYSYVRNNPLRYTDPTGNSWLGDAWNWAKNSAKSLFSNTAPTPASTAKLPSNTPNTSIKLANKNGSNPTSFTNEKKDPSLLSKLGNEIANNGHIDIEFSISRVVGVGGGMKFDKIGKTQQVSLNGGSELGRRSTPGRLPGSNNIGGSILFSTLPVQQNSVSNNITISAIIALQFGYDPKNPINTLHLEGAGFGCCGYDASLEFTGKTIPYSEVDPTEAAKFRSLQLREIYGN